MSKYHTNIEKLTKKTLREIKRFSKKLQEYLKITHNIEKWLNHPTILKGVERPE